MNRRALKAIVIVAAALVAALVAIELGNDESTATDQGLLVPDLKGRINDVTSLTVLDADGEVTTVISRASGAWRATSRDDYPADVGTIREVLLAIADARRIEQKTSNPERYGQLGVADPGSDEGAGVLLSIAGEGFDYELVVGNTAQGNYRYVRIPGEAESWLIDRNPGIPDEPGGWLQSDIIDIDTSRVSAATISHAGGDTIGIGKRLAEDTDYEVADIPEGRELSYPSVANSIAGALRDLGFEDVRKGTVGEPSVTTEFRTFDGVRVSVLSVEEDDGTWISLAADRDEGVTPDESGTGDPAAEIAAINDRVGGWAYRIPGYRAAQMTRRWDDILKAQTN